MQRDYAEILNGAHESDHWNTVQFDIDYRALRLVLRPTHSLAPNISSLQGDRAIEKCPSPSKGRPLQFDNIENVNRLTKPRTESGMCELCHAKCTQVKEQSVTYTGRIKGGSKGAQRRRLVGCKDAFVSVLG